MKKLLIILSFLGLLFSCNDKPITPKGDIDRKVMPSFRLLSMDSTIEVSTDIIKKGKKSVFFFFSPDCPHCQALTKTIISNHDKLANVEFCFLSTYPYLSIKQYYNRNDFNKFSNLKVAFDVDGFFPAHYTVTSVPYLAVFDEDRHLKGISRGEASIEKIKRIIFE